MIVWRLARGVYPALDGQGARRFGGRWNSPGSPMVYAAEHLSLALLEVLVHLDPDLIPDDYCSFKIDVPDDLTIDEVNSRDLPSGWDTAVACPACREIGDRWLRAAESPVLRVPSAIVPEETNILINPEHPESSRVSLLVKSGFKFDDRLKGRV